MQIKELINEYLSKRNANERFASFDYCYNYFHSFYENNNLLELASDDNIQMSCLQLGFYLASWGMMRNQFLLNKSVKNYEKLIIEISKMPSKLWEIDVDRYNKNNRELLLDCKDQIIKVFNPDLNPSDTLVTKIMLGVFANVPAFDRNFINSQIKVRKFNENALITIKMFYEDNKTFFDSFNEHTLQFSKGNNLITTNVPYTKAKLIDMYGFMDGQQFK